MVHPECQGTALPAPVCFKNRKKLSCPAGTVHQQQEPGQSCLYERNGHPLPKISQCQVPALTLIFLEKALSASTSSQRMVPEMPVSLKAKGDSLPQTPGRRTRKRLASSSFIYPYCHFYNPCWALGLFDEIACWEEEMLLFRVEHPDLVSWWSASVFFQADWVEYLSPTTCAQRPFFAVLNFLKALIPSPLLYSMENSNTVRFCPATTKCARGFAATGDQLSRRAQWKTSPCRLPHPRTSKAHRCRRPAQPWTARRIPQLSNTPSPLHRTLPILRHRHHE